MGELLVYQRVTTFLASRGFEKIYQAKNPHVKEATVATDRH